jgi:hypothetical protein
MHDHRMREQAQLQHSRQITETQGGTRSGQIEPSTNQTKAKCMHPVDMACPLKLSYTRKLGQAVPAQEGAGPLPLHAGWHQAVDWVAVLCQAPVDVPALILPAVTQYRGNKGSE